MPVALSQRTVVHHLRGYLIAGSLPPGVRKATASVAPKRYHVNISSVAKTGEEGKWPVLGCVCDAVNARASRAKRDEVPGSAAPGRFKGMWDLHPSRGNTLFFTATAEKP